MKTILCAPDLSLLKLTNEILKMTNLLCFFFYSIENTYFKGIIVLGELNLLDGQISKPKIEAKTQLNLANQILAKISYFLRYS